MKLIKSSLKKGWLLYLRLRIAFALWWMRIRSGLNRVDAAKRLAVNEKLLASYEIGRISPPMYLIARMLTEYSASDSMVIFFCTLGTPLRFKCSAVFRLAPLSAAD